MEGINQEILRFLAKTRKLNKKELERIISKKYRLSDTQISECLHEFENKNLIYTNENDEVLFLSVDSGTAIGKVTHDKNGNVCVITNDGYNVIIMNEERFGLLNKDVVLINKIIKDNKGQRYAKVDKIIKRKSEQITCEVIFENGKNKLVAYNSKVKTYIRIDQKEIDKHGVGEILLVKLFTAVNSLDGKYVKTIGHVNEPDIDEKSILLDHGFPIEFSSKVTKELEKIPTVVDSEKEIKKGRKDLRDKMIVTIDGEDTKDIDDSVGVERLPNGNYKLYVNIADVSHYVKEGSAIWQAAFERKTSVYVNDTVNPMLHAILSNGICSLHPHVDRLTVTCEMIIDKKGKIVDYDIYESIINSKKKMTYENVNKILIDNEAVPGYKEFYDQIKLMEELSSILESEKQRRGYVSFCKNELKAFGKGDNIYFKEKTQRIGEKIIENFMLAANETVAQHFFYLGLPFIYRVHEAPKEEDVKEFLAMLNNIGIKFKNCKNINTNSFIQNVEKTIEQKCENSEVLSELLLANTMKKAKYSNINIGHFGLALKNYTHFTSPIRRFADLEVHRLIKLYSKCNHFEYNDLEEYLSMVARQCTERSIEAEKCEREARQMRIAEYLEHNIGKEFEGVITYITKEQLKVKTSEGFSGNISIKDLQGDKYKYSQKENCIAGTNNKETYYIGSPILISVLYASKKNRNVKFGNGRFIEKQKERVLVKKN